MDDFLNFERIQKKLASKQSEPLSISKRFLKITILKKI